MSRLLLLILGLFALACASPLARLQPGAGGPALQLIPVKVEDHSRQLKRIRPLAPGESNAPAARRAALQDHARWLETTFRIEAAACGVPLAPEAPNRLELTLTDLGEVRTKYIVYGIASGVAWGVGTGLLAHNPHLAVALGGYELVEESAFWIGGSALFSSYSAPAVVEARLYVGTAQKPVWTETYYALTGRAWTKDLPEPIRTDRAVQLRASLQKVILKILEDLEDIPGFPKATRKVVLAPAGTEDLKKRITTGEVGPDGAE
jgi:hypothetical protein